MMPMPQMPQQGLLIRIFVFWVISTMLTTPAVYAISISDAQVTPFVHSAMVIFGTDVVAQSSVNLTVNGNPRTFTQGSYATNHAILITGLDPQTQYQAVINAMDLNGQTTQATQSFTTRATSDVFFHIEAPLISNGAPFTINIMTAPYTPVLYYINAELQASRTADASGRIQITDVRLPLSSTEHTLRFTYTIGEQTLEAQHRVAMDAVPPAITFDNIPHNSQQGAFSLTGNVSKLVNITVDSYNFMTNVARREGQTTADSRFSVGVSLTNGMNELTFRATDHANNIYERKFNVFVDTEDIQILETNLGDLSPSYSREVRVRGKVNKPHAIVRIYVNRQPSSQGGLVRCQYPEIAQNYGGDWAEILDDYFCDEDNSSSTGDVFHTRADRNGLFAKDIILAGYLDGQNFQISTGGGVDTDGFNPERDRNISGLGIEYDNSQARNVVTVMAIDAVGRTDREQAFITYASCGAPGEWIVTLGEVIPAKVLPDHVFSGVASIAFSMGLEYFGPSPEWPAISRLEFRRQRLSNIDERDNAPIDLLDPSQCTISPSSGRIDQAYVYCNLRQWPPSSVNQSERYQTLEDKEFLNFPMEFRISYASIDPYTGNTTAPKTQIICQDINVFVDKRLPPDKIPEDLLNTSVKALDDTIATIDSILRPLETINLATTGVCLGTYVFTFFSSVGEKFTCINPTFRIGPRHAQYIEQVLRGAKEGQEMETLRSMIESLDSGGNMPDFQDVEYTACAEKIISRLRLERFQTTVCDRIFCPVVPTGQYYVNEMVNNQRLGFGLDRTSACNELGPYATSLQVGNPDVFTKQEGCGKEYNDEWGRACLGIDAVKESNMLANPDDERNQPGVSEQISRVLNNLNFCAENEAQENRHFFKTGDNAYRQDPDQGPYQGKYRLSKDYQYGYTVDEYGTVNPGDTTQRLDFYTDEELGITGSNRQYRGQENLTTTPYVHTVNGRLAYVPEYRSADGNTQPLVYNPGRSEYVVDPRPGRGDRQILVTKYDDNYYVTNEGEIFSKSGSSYQQVETVHVCKKDGNYKPCEAGETAIAGPRELQQRQGPKNLIDPAGSFLNSVRCVCLPAIQGYLQQIRNILDAIRTCFKGILVSGEFNAGVCKAILTQYLCDWIFEALSCIVDSVGGATPEHTLGNPDATPVQRGFAALSAGGKAVRDRAFSRYGNTNSFKALFTQRKLVHTVCLAAFGYDWVPDIKAAVSTKGGSFQINSTGGIPVATRRFMGADPNSGLARHVYHVGYFLFAGSNINWRVELVCSNDNSCNYPGPNGTTTTRCDCSYGNTGQEQILPLSPLGGPINPQSIGPQVSPGGYRPGGYNPYQSFSYGRVHGLRGGVARSGDSITGPQTEIYESIVHEVRYDKVRLSWVTNDASSQDANKNGVVETPIRSIGEPPIDVCSFQIQLLRFSCGRLTQNRFGDVFFSSPNPLRPDKDVYQPGDIIKIISDIEVNFPLGTDPEDYVPKYAKIQFFDEQNRPQSQVITVRNELLLAGPKILPPGGFIIPTTAAVQPGTTATTLEFVPQSLRYVPETRIINGVPSQVQINPVVTDIQGSLIPPESGVFVFVNPGFGDNNNPADPRCGYVFARSGDLATYDQMYQRYLQERQLSGNNQNYSIRKHGLCDYTAATFNADGTLAAPGSIGNVSDGIRTISIAVRGRVDATDQKFGMKAVFAQPAQNPCGATNTLSWTAKVTLHDSNFRSPDDQPRYNAETGPSTFIFEYIDAQGTRIVQQKTVPIRVACPTP